MLSWLIQPTGPAAPSVSASLRAATATGLVARGSRSAGRAPGALCSAMNTAHQGRRRPRGAPAVARVAGTLFVAGCHSAAAQLLLEPHAPAMHHLGDGATGRPRPHFCCAPPARNIVDAVIFSTAPPRGKGNASGRADAAYNTALIQKQIEHPAYTLVSAHPKGCMPRALCRCTTACNAT